MLESPFKSVRVIRGADHIRVGMQVDTMRKRGDNLICKVRFRITDQQDSLFEITLISFLS
jgi:hypothetical protein